MEGGSSHDYRAAAGELTKIPGWKDADELLRECREKGEMMEEHVLQAAKEKELLAQQRAEARIKKAAKRRKIILAVTIPLLCLAVAFAIFFRVRILPERRYQAAVAAQEAGDVVTAYEGFLSMGEYKDSLERTDALYKAYKPAKLKAANVGDTVYFGSYEQDYDTKNGKEDIAWLMLAKEKKGILVISKYGLDAASFHNRQESVTWDNCALRKWLNSTFIETAFTPAEQKQLVPTIVLAQKNPKYETDPGKDTKDRVFLLSIDEAKRYFKTGAQRKCTPTYYAYKRGVAITNENNTSLCWWWLRSPGGEDDYAAFVNLQGAIHDYGSSVYNYKTSAVRPAMWIENN